MIDDFCQKCGKAIAPVEAENADIEIKNFKRRYSLCSDCAESLAQSIRGFMEPREAGVEARED